MPWEDVMVQLLDTPPITIEIENDGYGAESAIADLVRRLNAATSPGNFAFIDADKPNYDAYYEAVLPRLSERALIAIDNTLWSGRVLHGQHPKVNAGTMMDGLANEQGGFR